MENLPIDAKSLPSRIFHSETEDKIYVGEPGDYKEVGGGGDGLPPSETGKFLVGGATEWEKRRIAGSDLTLSTIPSGNRIPVFATGSQQWVNNGYNSSEAPSAFSIPIRTTTPNSGRLKANNAIESNDLVPLGQLEGMLNADNIDYDNAASGLRAETVQEAVDELSGHIETKADDNTVVKLSGNQTIAGVKTFSSSPIVPTATTTTQAVNKGQMDTALTAYVNADAGNTTGNNFSLDKVVLRNPNTGRTTSITKPNTDSADSDIIMPGFGGGTKVMPISVNGVSAGPSGDINLTLDIDKFISVALGGSSTLLNVNFAAGNPDITGYEEIEIGIQFLGKPETTTDFHITFNSNTNPVYNSTVVDNSGTTTSFTNQSGFRFKYDSENGFYTFKVKNYMQTGIPRIITGSGVEFGDSTTEPKTWTFGGGFHSDANITTLQIKSVDGTTNVPYMRVTVKRIF